MKKLFLLIFVCLFNPYLLYPCTDFILKDAQKNTVVGRSLEFGIPLQSQVMIYPKAKQKTSLIIGNQKGMSWVSKYAFVGIVGLGIDTV